MERLDVSTEELAGLLEQARREPLPEDGYRKLKAAIDTLFFRSVLARFDSRYAVLARSGGERLSLELRCLDPSPHVGERLGRARAAVLFSANSLSKLECPQKTSQT